ncbi:MarR family winged helix-turn-helix transcriptional regulator [Microbacterium sp.]|uniref:MarR family winged helix-turn-helix transcriptional regulator n=1 Tax=Microbacterium sp. TaxID=51671 RepID=UPI0037C689F1
MPSADRPSAPGAKLATALEQLARARRMRRQALATARGVSPLQLDVLTVLAAGAPPEPTIGLLARELGVAQPTITDAVAALERKGHVVREGRPGTRHVLVRATAAGRELGEAEDPLAQAAGRLEPELRDAALEAALTMIAALVDDGTITVARTCLTCRFHRRDDVGSHCDLLKVPLPPGDLRVNCPEHRSAA